MTKKELYKKMNLSETDIEKGETLFNSYSADERKKFLSDIYAEYQPDGFFKSLSFIYGDYPKFRKAILVNFVIEGSEEEKKRLAGGLSNPYNNEKIENFFHLIFDWINETIDSKIFESLSRGLLFYYDKDEVKKFIGKNIDMKQEFANGLFSWLYIQPDWFRDKYKDIEIKLWHQLQEKWGENLRDEFKIREINKSLGLNVNEGEIWLHEIENPWNFSDIVINKLNKEGINIKLDGNIGEFAMGSPAITGLILNDNKINKSIGGPFLTDDDNSYLCCTTFSRDEGFKLVLIDLKTNSINELHSSKSTYTPYKFENGNL